MAEETKECVLDPVGCHQTDELCKAVAAFGSRRPALRLLAGLRSSDSDMAAFTRAYKQCVSTEFLQTHSARDFTGGIRDLQPKFRVVGVALDRVVDEEKALHDRFLGHPMLGFGPQQLPGFVKQLITKHCKANPCSVMCDLLPHLDEVCSLFGVHGAVLAIASHRWVRAGLFHGVDLAKAKKKALDPAFYALAAALVCKKEPGERDTWATLTAKIRESLPAQVPAAVNYSGADELTGLVEFRARNDAPPSMQSHVDAAAAEHAAKLSGDEARLPINEHLYGRDGAEQQSCGVSWLLRTASGESLGQDLSDRVKNSCRGASLRLHQSPADGGTIAMLQAALHPYEKNVQMKSNFVRWLQCSEDNSIRLPTMVGESTRADVGTDGLATHQLVVHLMHLVRLFRLVDPKPVAVGRLWHGKRLQYYTMELCTKEGGTRGYALTPWGDSFDMSTAAGRSGAVLRERACMRYCRWMEVKLDSAMVMLVTMKDSTGDAEFDGTDVGDTVSLVHEPLDPCEWWSFPTSWPAFMRSELGRCGFSRCRLIKTSHGVAVFHGYDTERDHAVCLKVHSVKPVQMLTSYEALAETEYRDVVMSILEDFDTYLGHVVVARWEDGATLDKVDKEQRHEVAKIVSDLVLGMNKKGFVHGDLHVGNVIIQQRKRTAPTRGGTALRVTLIDLDNLRCMTPPSARTGRKCELRTDKAGLNRIRRELALCR